ncbi:hypothetical protein [Algoriphagus boritolerans]|uniref:hypothetical protein n=1 Tax=Algoriphagus boritolerans TaxID=308111 RepID=UPI000AC1E25D
MAGQIAVCCIHFGTKKTGIQLPSYTIQHEKKYRTTYSDGDQAIRFSKQIPTKHQLIDVDQKNLPGKLG